MATQQDIALQMVRQFRRLDPSASAENQHRLLSVIGPALCQLADTSQRSVSSQACLRHCGSLIVTKAAWLAEDIRTVNNAIFSVGAVDFTHPVQRLSAKYLIPV